MKKLLLPALGAAFVLGAPTFAAAQFMAPGQPGWTTSNRTLPPGSSGLSPQNVPTPSPFTVPPSPSFTQGPFIGQRGDLNRAEPEFVGPGEPDASGRIGPTADRERARFTGERGPDGKLLPTYVPQRAQAVPPAQQTMPQGEERMRSGQTPSTPQMRREQTPRQRPGSGAADRPGQPSDQLAPPPMDQRQGSGSMQQGTPRQQRMTQPPSDRRQPMRAGGIEQHEMSQTAALNALSAEGYTNIGRIERVGDSWQATAMKEGRQVTVSVDPQTSTVRER